MKTEKTERGFDWVVFGLLLTPILIGWGMVAICILLAMGKI